MSDKDESGPAEAVKGAVEGVKGKAKEAAGAVTGQDDLVGKAKRSRTRHPPSGKPPRRRPRRRRLAARRQRTRRASARSRTRSR